MIVELLNLQDAIHDAFLLIDEAWEVASMMHLAARVANIDPSMAASALTRILELAQTQGGFAKKAAARLQRNAIKKRKR
jgi:hypothetical protein